MPRPRPPSRRGFLQIGGLGLGGASLQALARYLRRKRLDAASTPKIAANCVASSTGTGTSIGPDAARPTKPAMSIRGSTSTGGGACFSKRMPGSLRTVWVTRYSIWRRSYASVSSSIATSVPFAFIGPLTCLMTFARRSFHVCTTWVWSSFCSDTVTVRNAF